MRLEGYDYHEEGGYFVTVVTHGRENLFGKIVDGEMALNPCGQIVQQTWHDLARHNTGIELDAFIVMPNHIHGIIILNGAVGAGPRPAQVNPIDTVESSWPIPVGLPEIVRQLKSFSAREINHLRHTPEKPVWQRNYYDHVIRSEKDYDNIVNYILENPQFWLKDDEFHD